MTGKVVRDGVTVMPEGMTFKIYNHDLDIWPLNLFSSSLCPTATRMVKFTRTWVVRNCVNKLLVCYHWQPDYRMPSLADHQWRHKK